MDKQTAKHKARCYHDKCVASQIEADLQVMVASVIDIYALHIEKGEFDPYPSCNHSLKKFCYCNKKKYVGKYEAYSFYGDSVIEVYCKILSWFVGSRGCIPFTLLGEVGTPVSEGCEAKNKD